jgi:hypothetical protein
LQHIFYIIFSNNVTINFIFVEVKETQFGENLALNSCITPPPPPHNIIFCFVFGDKFSQICESFWGNSFN